MHSMCEYAKKCCMQGLNMRLITVFSDVCKIFQQSFKCLNGFCLDLKYVCDGKANCPQGEDEEKCEHGMYANIFVLNQSKTC